MNNIEEIELILDSLEYSIDLQKHKVGYLVAAKNEGLDVDEDLGNICRSIESNTSLVQKLKDIVNQVSIKLAV
jgi:hypothetical protein